MRNKLFILSIFLVPFIILSCGPDNIAAPENAHFGMVGGSYLFGTWDKVPGEKHYEVYQYNGGDDERYRYSLIKNGTDQNYVIEYMSKSPIGKTIIVQGSTSLGISTKVLPNYGECKYDCVNNILSWTKCPIETQYLLVNTSDKSKFYDVINTNISSYDEVNLVSDNRFSCQLQNDKYYAVYININETYYRMTKWYSTNDEELKPQVRLSSYETGSNLSFNITWTKVNEATDYTVYIYSAAESKWVPVGNTSETSMTVKPKDFLELNDEDSFTNFKVRINLPLKTEFTNSIQVPLPVASFSYYSKCKILNDIYSTHLIVMRIDSNLFQIYWGDGKQYYFSSYLNNDTSKIYSWKKNGVYSTGQKIRISEDSFEAETFFLHTVDDWNYNKMNRISNLVEVKLK